MTMFHYLFHASMPCSSAPIATCRAGLLAPLLPLLTPLLPRRASAPFLSCAGTSLLHTSSSATTAVSDSGEPFATALELPVQRGLCIAVALPDASASNAMNLMLPVDELHEHERAVMQDMNQARQVQYAGGRIAMRRALRSLGAADAAAPVLRDDAGAPALLTNGAFGSISHTRGLAAAIACIPPEPWTASADPLAPRRSAVGIDVEHADRQLSPGVVKRCLHEEERRTLGAAPPRGGRASPEWSSDLLLRLSLKEALYKAIHPLVRATQRTIRWHSVQVQPAADGACEIRLEDLEEAAGFGLTAEARWDLIDGFYVTTAHVQRR